MNLSILYYIGTLIRKGHEAQYQNMNGTAKRPCLFFTIPQIIFIFISILYVSFNKEGLSKDVIDYILSALSIMTGLFLGLIVIVLDKLNRMEFKNENGKSTAEQLHSWQYIRQFSSITSYSILISLLLIFILICSLLFGKEVDLTDLHWIPFDEIDGKAFALFVKALVIYSIRFLFCYFLLDFLLMTVYSVSLIHQSIISDLNNNEPKIEIYKEEPVCETIKREIGKNYIMIISIVLFIALVFAVAYVAI